MKFEHLESMRNPHSVFINEKDTTFESLGGSSQKVFIRKITLGKIFLKKFIMIVYF